MRTNWKAGLCILCSFGLSQVLASGPAVELFDEELKLRPLRDGKVAARFSFTTNLAGVAPRDPRNLGSEDASQHYTVFPLALGQILREYAVTELHLSLNAGKWDYDRWGYPDEPSVGSGAELWAWMGGDGASTSIDGRWKGLRNALAGLFCASLGALDDQRTTSPVDAFTPEGALPSWMPAHELRHASLPSEHVCTENLTPFLKLLPCKSLSGIASLLNPHKVFDADWHGMGVHVSWTEDAGVQVRLTFQAVFDPVRSTDTGKRDFSFRSIFDRTIERPCPVAHDSHVAIVLPTDTAYSLSPATHSANGSMAIFDLAAQSSELNVEIKWPVETAFEYPRNISPLGDLSVQRTLYGSSQAHGELSLVLKNNLARAQDVIYLETMPWLLQFYLHTLRVESNGTTRDDLVSDMQYIPPVPHSRPTTLQLQLTLPAHATLHLTLDVTKSFLRYTEHPPDAQRGWDLPPAVLVPLQTTASHEANASVLLDARGRRMYTPALLVDLATPDFSMPYNVIIMSCTLMAMIFGSVFNLLTRKFVVVDLRTGA
ncbi:hypothetical protein PLICRDRAFT_39104 [Plicaturopsis crispa FD-325 SS-3]|nr:hypothetical protein PLICRDRAFT_39104 [Plicaturopsis crispa FD-325 SS-3]